MEMFTSAPLRRRGRSLLWPVAAALAVAFCGATAATAPEAPSCAERRGAVRAGGWRTLETFWNAEATAFFKAPRNARVKVRYGGTLGVDRQQRTLDGQRITKLTVGRWAVLYARIQIAVPKDGELVWLVCPGDLGTKVPVGRF